MRILFAGDWHGNMQHAALSYEAASASGCDVLFQLGDFGYWPHVEWGADFITMVGDFAFDTGIRTFFIDGNHDNHDALRTLREGYPAGGVVPVMDDSPFFYVPRGTVLTFDGCTVMGYGGAFSIDRKMRVLGESWWVDEMIDPEHVATIPRCEIDILATHDAPSWTRTSWYGKSTFYETQFNQGQIDTLVEKTNPRLVVTGHWHERISQLPENPSEPRIEVLDCDGTLNDSWLVLDTNDWTGDRQ
jgi:Icc-related predicted phosphoesterase